MLKRRAFLAGAGALCCTRSGAVTAGILAAPSPLNRAVVTHGDSITAAFLVPYNYLSQLIVGLMAANPGIYFTGQNTGAASMGYATVGSLAVPPSQVGLTMIQDAPTAVDPYRTSNGLSKKLIVYAGRNDVAISHLTGAQTYAVMQTYLDARIAAGWAEADMILCTMLPALATSEVERAAFNAAVVGLAKPGGGTYACTVAPLHLNMTIGQAGQNLDTTYYFDGIHPTQAGYTIIASVIQGVYSL